MTYDPAEYWTDVAERVRTRGVSDNRFLAGNAGPFHRYKQEATLARLMTLDVRGATVLELGSGPGGNLINLLKQHPIRLVGCDIAPGMVALARELLGTSAEILQLSESTLPFADRELDIAFTVTVLQHNTADVAQRLVRELCRVANMVEIIEDMTALRPRSWQGSYFVRPTSDYLSWVTAEGFQVLDVCPMNAWASEKAWLAIRRGASALELRHKHSEGDAVSSLEHALERAALSVTRRIDGRLPMLSGKTAIRFRRV